MGSLDHDIAEVQKIIPTLTADKTFLAPETIENAIKELHLQYEQEILQLLKS